MLLLVISLACIDVPPHLVVTLSGLTMAMRPDTQPSTDLEMKNCVDLQRHSRLRERERRGEGSLVALFLIDEKLRHRKGI